MELIKVRADSPTAKVAGAIAGAIRQHGDVDVQAIGAGAVNQAAKALTLAYQYLIAEQIQMAITPAFVDVQIGKQKRTAIRFSVHVCPMERALTNGYGSTAATEGGSSGSP